MLAAQRNDTGSPRHSDYTYRAEQQCTILQAKRYNQTLRLITGATQTVYTI